MSLNDKIAGGALVCEFRLPNTYRSGDHVEDMLAGPVPIAGATLDGRYLSNADLKMSNVALDTVETASVLENTFSITESLAEPFTGASVVRTVGHLRAVNVDSFDDIRFRDFDDEPFLLKAGLPTDDYGDFLPWLDGVVESHAYDFNAIDIALTPESKKLQSPVPVDIFGPEAGDAEGQVKPIYFGPVLGDTPVDLGGGLYYMTAGELETSDNVQTTGIGAFEYDDENLYFLDELEIQQGYVVDDSGYTLLTDSDFTFVKTGSTVTSTVGIVDAVVSVEGGAASLDVDAEGRVTVTADDDTLRAYTSRDFNWTTTPEGVKNLRDPKVTVDVGGDISVVDVGGRWFKIAGNGTGPVVFNLGGNAASCKLIVRAIREPFQDFTFGAGSTPDSITPEFGYEENGVAVWNHELVYADLNSDTLTFEYEATTDVLLCALWFEEITYQDKPVVEVTIEFDSPVYQADVAFTLEGGAVDFVDWSPAEPSPLPAPSATTVSAFGNVEANRISFRVELGGQFAFNLDSLKVSDVAQYGVTFEDNGTITLKPPPTADTVGNPAASGSYGSFFKSRAFTSIDQGINYKMTGKARLASSDTDEVFITMGTDNVVRVTEEVNDFEVFSTPLFTGVMGARAWRGTSITAVGLNKTNPDVDFTVILSEVHFEPTQYPEAAIDVSTLVDDVRTPLQVWRVPDAKFYKNILPLGLAVYDDAGYLTISRKYLPPAVNAVGFASDLTSIEAFRIMSDLATGEDLISCSFEGENVGFKLDTQQPLTDHINTLNSALDYYGVEDTLGDTLSIYRRWRYDTYPVDFEWETGTDIEAGSVQRVGAVPRQSRYVVEYAIDSADPQNTKSKRSDYGYTGTKLKTIPTPLVDGADAQDIADLYYRDSERNGLFTLNLIGTGLGWTIGQVGFINDPQIPRRKACLIKEIGVDQGDGKTPVLVKVFKGKGVHRG